MIKLLIVDDERMIRLGIKKSLPWQEIGVQEVLLAGSVSEALPIIINEHPDIMLVDIQMGKVNGIALIKQIRELKISIKIVVMTGFDRFDYAHACLHLNIQEFLLKPLDEDKLIEVVSDQIAAIQSEKMLCSTTHSCDPTIHFEDFWKDIISRLRQNINYPSHIKELFLEFESSPLLKDALATTLNKCCFEFALEVFYSYYGQNKIHAIGLEKLLASLTLKNTAAKMAITSNFIDDLLNSTAQEPSYLVNNIKIYVRQNIAQNISVAKLAEEFHMNAAYLSRLFKQVTGEGCNAYITRKKIEKAQYLLQNSDLKIYEISEAVGFSDANYFCSTFKKIIGLSPKQYRT